MIKVKQPSFMLTSKVVCVCDVHKHATKFVWGKYISHFIYKEKFLSYKWFLFWEKEIRDILKMKVRTPNKGTKLEIKLLEVRHMSRPKFLYIGLPNFVSKMVLPNVCGLHMNNIDFGFFKITLLHFKLQV